MAAGPDPEVPDDPALAEADASLADGRTVAADELAQLVYDDLRRIAGAFFRREPPGQTLQPTALVHEAYLRLADQRKATWESRAHFLAIAARTMRRVLVDAARARGTSRRGGDRERLTLLDAPGAALPSSVDLLDLEAALGKLAEVDPRYMKIVELRFFAGLSGAEIGGILGISERMVKKDWAKARAMLELLLEDEEAARG